MLTVLLDFELEIEQAPYSKLVELQQTSYSGLGIEQASYSELNCWTKQVLYSKLKIDLGSIF